MSKNEQIMDPLKMVYGVKKPLENKMENIQKLYDE
jgi:hypothetical protein